MAALGVAFDVGDIDGDGELDLAFGAPTAVDQNGAVGVWWGPLEGTTTLDDGTDVFEGEEVAGGLGQSVGILDDVTGDGRADVLAGMPAAFDGAGGVVVVSGEVFLAAD